jgi:hypothetical protein
MGKGSGRRPQEITDEQMEQAWNAIFAGHPNEDDFAKVKKDIVKRKEDVIKEDDYGNELPELKKFKNDPDRFYDESGDA